MPEISTVVGIWCALMTTLQGYVAGFTILERHRRNIIKTGGTSAAGVFISTPVTIVMIIGAVITLTSAVWMIWRQPLRIQTVEKTVYVDKYLPCPPTKSGTAITHGAQAPANSGSNNTTTYGGTPPNPKSKP